MDCVIRIFLKYHLTQENDGIGPILWAPPSVVMRAELLAPTLSGLGRAEPNLYSNPWQ
jgi:hypothetical protein